MNRLLLLATLLLMGPGFPLPVRAEKPSGGTPTRENLELRRKQLEKDISLLNKKLDENAGARKKTLSTLTLLRGKIQRREKLIANCDAQLALLSDSLRLCAGRIASLRQRQDTLAHHYRHMVRVAYKNRDTRLWLLYLMGGDSPGQALRRAQYLRRFTARFGKEATRLRENADSLEREQERLALLHGKAGEMRERVAKERLRLRDEEGESTRMVGRLQRDREQYRRELEGKNRQIRDLNRKIAELVRSSSGQGKGKKTSTTVDRKLSQDFAANKGKLPWPVEGVIVERFGKHAHPIYKNVELPHNNGVTLAVAHESPVKAVFGGTVSQVVVMPGFNQCVLVSHGDYFTLYAKLESVTVKTGEKIATGQTLGSTDSPQGGEGLFHFELWENNEPKNPESWLRK